MLSFQPHFQRHFFPCSGAAGRVSSGPCWKTEFYQLTLTSMNIKNGAAFLLALCAFAGLGRSETVTVTNTLVLEPDNVSFEGKDIVVTGGRLTINGAHSFASLQLLSGAVVAHAPAPNGESDHWLDLTVAQDVFVDSSSRIEVSSAGYG